MSRVAASALVLVVVAIILVLGGATVLSGAQNTNGTIPEMVDFVTVSMGTTGYVLFLLVGAFFVALIVMLWGLTRR